MNYLKPPPPGTVFYAAKRVENSCIYEYFTEMTPLREHHCVSYSFTVTKVRADERERAFVCDVTTDIEEAERIFDLLVKNKVPPCHLFDIISDLIV